MLHALLATGDGQQFAVKCHIPVPVQSEFAEGSIEGRAVAVAFGIGKGAVNVKNQGLLRHCLKIYRLREQGKICY